jgi:hypothetical protein
LSGPIWANVSVSGLVTGTPLAVDPGTHLQVQVTDSRGAAATTAIVLAVANKCDGVTVIPLLQCQALAALYDSAGGNGWTDRTGWWADLNPCGWAGLGCSGPNISVIRLHENNLVGTLPPTLGNLTGLTQLDISENEMLSGSIPPGLWAITSLQTVVLAHNNLGGGIPPFTVPLPSLTRLGLDSNPLGGQIPVSMTATNLPALQELSLDENQLGGEIPDEFFATPWPVLGNLRLDENQLTGQPSGFSSTNFPVLFRLELNNNPWAGAGGQAIPAEITTLGFLTVLDLSEANFTGAVTGFTATNFPAMTTLFLCGNLALTATDPELTFVSGLDPQWNTACP